MPRVNDDDGDDDDVLVMIMMMIAKEQRAKGHLHMTNLFLGFW